MIRMALCSALFLSTAVAQAGGDSCVEDDYVPVSEGNSAEREVSKAAAHIDYDSLLSEPDVGGCSGILVSEDLLLTAAHCISPPRVGHDSLSEVCDDLRVRFDYTKVGIGDTLTSAPAKVYRCESVVHFAYEGEGGSGVDEEDHALIRLEDDPGLDRGWVDVRLETDEDITVGMFHHPDGVPKQMSVGTLTIDLSPYLIHDLDSCVSSSGAGLLDNQGHVMGVHVADDMAKSLGYYWTSADLRRWGIDEASPRSKVRLFGGSRSTTIRTR